jgi:hypothetical protein
MNERDPRLESVINPQVVIGAAIVLFGLVLTASNLGVAGFDTVLRFWPLAFSAFGAAILLQPGCAGGRRLFGIILVVAGIWQTANTAFHLGIYIDDYWPLLIVGAGLLIVWRSMRPVRPDVEDYTDVGAAPAFGASAASPAVSAAPAGTDAGNEITLNQFAFLGGVTRKVTSPRFRRGTASVFMGGVVLDFRGSEASGGESSIEVFAMWGGIEIKVPPDWEVVNEISALLGGVDDKSAHTQPLRHRLVLRGIVVMGGVEVKS